MHAPLLGVEARIPGPIPTGHRRLQHVRDAENGGYDDVASFFEQAIPPLPEPPASPRRLDPGHPTPSLPWANSVIRISS